MTTLTAPMDAGRRRRHERGRAQLNVYYIPREPADPGAVGLGHDAQQFDAAHRQLGHEKAANRVGPPSWHRRTRSARPPRFLPLTAERDTNAYEPAGSFWANPSTGPVSSSASSNGRAAGQARPLLLAVAGGEPPNPTPVRVDAAADLGPAGADGLTCSERHGAGLTKKQHRQGEVSEKCSRTRSLPGRATAR